MKKIFAITGFCFSTSFVFAQQQQAPEQSQNRISNLTNILIQNVSNVSLNNNENKVNVLANPRPRTLINRPITHRVSASNTNINKAPTIPQVRRVTRRPVPRIRRTTTATTIQQATNNVINEPKVNNESNPSNQNIVFVSNTDLQMQNFVSNVSKNQQVQSDNGNGQLNLNIDLSLNLKVKTNIKSGASSSSSSGSSSHYKSRTFSKKFAKFKRNFFGKLSSHKKSKRRIDICFNWKS